MSPAAVFLKLKSFSPQGASSKKCTSVVQTVGNITVRALKYDKKFDGFCKGKTQATLQEL